MQNINNNNSIKIKLSKLTYFRLKIFKLLFPLEHKIIFDAMNKDYKSIAKYYAKPKTTTNCILK
jgi:hypothetical protein